MNKKTILTGVALISLFCSCRKDRNCVCSQDGKEIYKATYTRVKKSEANTYCQALQNTYTPGSNVSCIVQ
ncbi:MAG: hypothetical protein J0L69_06375 [Bacteroidetes bacterium]|nr:hypothetical protein [Bacteroidota bacterium]